jgi:hypothetical protein
LYAQCFIHVKKRRSRSLDDIIRDARDGRATEDDPENAVFYMMNMIEDDVKKANGSKSQGFCIRCIQE